MEFKGVVKQVFSKTFAKKDGSGDVTTNEIWVEEEYGQYPQSGVFELKKDLPVPAEGESVTLQFSMATNEWTSPTGDFRVFGKNRCYRIDAASSGNAKTPSGQEPSHSAQAPDFLTQGDSSSDLPF